MSARAVSAGATPLWFERVLGVLAACLCVVAVAWPLFSATYPPMTDLPFHAAQTAIFAHYGDPAFHFSEQFELAPLSVPYLSSYLLGALFMQVFSATTAVKLATLVMLLSVPAGMALLSWGMGKTPLLGLVALPLVWGHLTHWGFINFVAALGMFAGSLGLSLAMTQPARSLRRLPWWLAAALVLLFCTHVFRYPFALLAVIGVGLVGGLRDGRFWSRLWPVLPSLGLFAWFWTHRPATVGGGLGPLALHTERLRELSTLVIDGFDDPGEMAGFQWHFAAVLLIAVVGGVLRYRKPPSGKQLQSERIAFGMTGLCFLGLLLGYLLLPMEIGDWWYVYPREATAVLYFGLALMVDLPKMPISRALAVALMAATSLNVSALVARHYRAFDVLTRDFDACAADLPMAPKLLYLVFDHGDTQRTQPPFLHLPAWVQAQKGGWLSFHFAVFGASPVRYRTDAAAVVPPPVPRRWEWTPRKFDLKTNGAFFDWFLLRSTDDPSRLFAADKSIRLASHHGKFWLFSRQEVGESSP